MSYEIVLTGDQTLDDVVDVMNYIRAWCRDCLLYTSDAADE